MEIHHAVLYGVVQGLAEFLPISSSAHLALLPHFMKIEDPGQVFDLFMHLGTLFAVVLYYRKDVVQMVGGLFSFRKAFMLQNILLALLGTAVFALPLHQLFSSLMRNPVAIGLNLSLFGVILYLVDRWAIGKEKEGYFNEKRRGKNALLIGAMQALAIFPGVSRSGITLTAARFCRFSREEGARFIFLLSVPTIMGAILEASLSLGKSGNFIFDWKMAMIGIVTSFVSGYLAIALFLKLLQKVSLLYFAFYRVIVGIALILLFLF